jgi:hypothetical protein
MYGGKLAVGPVLEGLGREPRIGRRKGVSFATGRLRLRRKRQLLLSDQETKKKKKTDAE